MIKLKIYEDSRNYTATVISLPTKHKIQGFNNLCMITVFGNDVLISSDSDESRLYLFFPCESELSHEFLSCNNLYRNPCLNADKSVKGYFQSKRCKALKLKGIISTGFVIPLNSITNLTKSIQETDFKIGDEFNEINGVVICKKYIKHTSKISNKLNIKKQNIIQNMVDSKFTPTHINTDHLLKNCHKLSQSDLISITYKLHGTSARYFNTLTKRPLSLVDKISKFFGAKIVSEDYNFVSASRQMIKSIDFKSTKYKSSYYNEDVWSKVGKKFFEGKLNKGESVYCEIIGKTYEGQEIQKNYSYGFNEPQAYIYRISNINPQGIEVDMPYKHMKHRAKELGVETCPELFYGYLGDFLAEYGAKNRDKAFEVGFDMEKFLTFIFNNTLLDCPSILHPDVVEEGFVLRIDQYPKPLLLKIKSKKFIMHETGMLDKEVENVEQDN